MKRRAKRTLLERLSSANTIPEQIGAGTKKTGSKTQTVLLHSVLKFSLFQIVKALSALSYRDVSNKTKQHVLHIFKENKTPSSALRILRAELEKKCKDTYTYEVSLADRAMLPTRDDMLYLYRLYNSGAYGGKNSIQMFECLEEKVESFNLANNSVGGKILYSTVPMKDELSFGVAIVTPLMAHVHHHIKHAGELVFLDATSNVDEYNLKLFLMATHSACGGLPFGTFLCSDEQQETLCRTECPTMHFMEKGKMLDQKYF